jgi:hypothetical protein
LFVYYVHAGAGFDDVGGIAVRVHGAPHGLLDLGLVLDPVPAHEDVTS